MHYKVALKELGLNVGLILGLVAENAGNIQVDHN